MDGYKLMAHAHKPTPIFKLKLWLVLSLFACSFSFANYILRTQKTHNRCNDHFFTVFSLHFFVNSLPGSLGLKIPFGTSVWIALYPSFSNQTKSLDSAAHIHSRGRPASSGHKLTLLSTSPTRKNSITH